MRFLGQYDTVIKQGRITLPGLIYKQFENSEVILRPTWEGDGLTIHTKSSWEGTIQHFKNKIQPFNNEHNKLFLFFVSNAHLSDISKKRTIKIPNPLIEHASLKDNLTLIGVDDHLEIYNRTTFNRFRMDVKEFRLELDKLLSEDFSDKKLDFVPIHNELIVPEEPKIITTYINQLLFNNLIKNPKNFSKLTPRQFEESVAEILLKLNWDVKLTKATVDGGVDIYAAKNNEIGEFLYLIECKHYNSRPVGVEVIRSLYGNVEAKMANAGLLVTSSYFSTAAKQFQEPLKQRIHLADYDNLVNWLEIINKNKSNIICV